MPTDDPDRRDFDRALPLRDLARALGTSMAALAHRYALGMRGVDTVILGVKNRRELAGCLQAKAEGTLPPDITRQIDALYSSTDASS